MAQGTVDSNKTMATLAIGDVDGDGASDFLRIYSGEFDGQGQWSVQGAVVNESGQAIDESKYGSDESRATFTLTDFEENGTIEGVTVHPDPDITPGDEDYEAQLAGEEGGIYSLSQTKPNSASPITQRLEAGISEYALSNGENKDEIASRTSVQGTDGEFTALQEELSEQYGVDTDSDGEIDEYTRYNKQGFAGNSEYNTQGRYVVGPDGTSVPSPVRYEETITEDGQSTTAVSAQDENYGVHRNLVDMNDDGTNDNVYVTKWGNVIIEDGTTGESKRFQVFTPERYEQGFRFGEDGLPLMPDGTLMSVALGNGEGSQGRTGISVSKTSQGDGSYFTDEEQRNSAPERYIGVTRGTGDDARTSFVTTGENHADNTKTADQFIEEHLQGRDYNFLSETEQQKIEEAYSELDPAVQAIVDAKLANEGEGAIEGAGSFGGLNYERKREQIFNDPSLSAQEQREQLAELDDQYGSTASQIGGEPDKNGVITYDTDEEKQGLLDRLDKVYETLDSEANADEVEEIQKAYFAIENSDANTTITFDTETGTLKLSSGTENGMSISEQIFAIPSLQSSLSDGGTEFNPVSAGGENGNLVQTNRQVYEIDESGNLVTPEEEYTGYRGDIPTVKVGDYVTVAGAEDAVQVKPTLLAQPAIEVGESSGTSEVSDKAKQVAADELGGAVTAEKISNIQIVQQDDASTAEVNEARVSVQYENEEGGVKTEFLSGDAAQKVIGALGSVTESEESLRELPLGKSLDELTFDDLEALDIGEGEEGKFSLDGGKFAVVTNDGNSFNVNGRIVFKDAEEFPENEEDLKPSTVYKKDNKYYYYQNGDDAQGAAIGTTGGGIVEIDKNGDVVDNKVELSSLVNVSEEREADYIPQLGEDNQVVIDEKIYKVGPDGSLKLVTAADPGSLTTEGVKPGDEVKLNDGKTVTLGDVPKEGEAEGEAGTLAEGTYAGGTYKVTVDADGQITVEKDGKNVPLTADDKKELSNELMSSTPGEGLSEAAIGILDDISGETAGEASTSGTITRANFDAAWDKHSIESIFGKDNYVDEARIRLILDELVIDEKTQDQIVKDALSSGVAFGVDQEKLIEAMGKSGYTVGEGTAEEDDGSSGGIPQLGKDDLVVIDEKVYKVGESGLLTAVEGVKVEDVKVTAASGDTVKLADGTEVKLGKLPEEEGEAGTLAAGTYAGGTYKVTVDANGEITVEKDGKNVPLTADDKKELSNELMSSTPSEGLSEAAVGILDNISGAAEGEEGTSETITRAAFDAAWKNASTVQGGIFEKNAVPLLSELGVDKDEQEKILKDTSPNSYSRIKKEDLIEAMDKNGYTVEVEGTAEADAEVVENSGGGASTGGKPKDLSGTPISGVTFKDLESYNIPDNGSADIDINGENENVTNNGSNFNIGNHTIIYDENAVEQLPSNASDLKADGGVYKVGDKLYYTNLGQFKEITDNVSGNGTLSSQTSTFEEVQKLAADTKEEDGSGGTSSQEITRANFDKAWDTNSKEGDTIGQDATTELLVGLGIGKDEQEEIKNAAFEGNTSGSVDQETLIKAMGKSGYTVGEGDEKESDNTGEPEDLKDESVDDVTFDELASKGIPIGDNDSINIDDKSVTVYNFGNNFYLQSEGGSNDRVVFDESAVEELPSNEKEAKATTVYKQDGKFYFNHKDGDGTLTELSVDGTLGDDAVKFTDLQKSATGGSGGTSSQEITRANFDEAWKDNSKEGDTIGQDATTELLVGLGIGKDEQEEIKNAAFEGNTSGSVDQETLIKAMGKSGYTVGEGTAAEDGSGGTDTTPRKDLKDISVDDVTFDDLATKDIPIGENGEINIDGESVLVTNNGNNFNLSSSDRVIFKEGDAEQFPTEGKLQEPTVYERDGDYYYSAFGVLRELSVDGTLGKTVKLEDIMGTTEEDDAEVVKEDGSGGTDTTRKDLKDISVDDVTFDDLVSKKIDGEADINIDGELMNVISDPNSFYVTSNESDGERIVFDESDAEPFPSNEGELVDFTVYAKGDKFYYKNAEGIKELSVDGDLLGEPLTFEDIMGTE